MLHLLPKGSEELILGDVPDDLIPALLSWPGTAKASQLGLTLGKSKNVRWAEILRTWRMADRLDSLATRNSWNGQRYGLRRFHTAGTIPGTT